MTFSKNDDKFVTIFFSIVLIVYLVLNQIYIQSNLDKDDLFAFASSLDPQEIKLYGINIKNNLFSEFYTD